MTNEQQPIIEKKKCKMIRKIRLATVLPLLFHYGSLILKTGKIPFLVTVYEWILEYIYDGIAGFIIQPLCEAFWGLKWYPQIYFWTGTPLLILFVLLSYIISMKEKSDDFDPKAKNLYDAFSGGRYRTVSPSLYRRFVSWMQLKFFAEQNNLSEESARSSVVTVFSGKKEQVVNLGQIQEWEWATEGVRLNYAAKEKQVRVSFDKDKDVYLLNKGDTCSRNEVYVTYLA